MDEQFLPLQGFEQVRKLHVDSEPFSVENGLTTPTFKHKRPQLLKHYKADIDRCTTLKPHSAGRIGNAAAALRAGPNTPQTRSGVSCLNAAGAA